MSTLKMKMYGYIKMCVSENIINRNKILATTTTTTTFYLTMHSFQILRNSQ
jgi:hypothetical protein